MRLFLYMSWHPKQLPEVAVLVTRSYTAALWLGKRNNCSCVNRALRVGFCLPGTSFALPPHGSYFPQFLVHLKNLWQVKTLHPADCRITSVCCSPFCFSLPSTLTDWSPNKPSLLPMELPCSVVSLSSLTHVGVPLWADVQSSEDGIWSPGTRVKCGFELPHLNV